MNYGTLLRACRKADVDGLKTLLETRHIEEGYESDADENEEYQLYDITDVYKEAISAKSISRKISRRLVRVLLNTKGLDLPVWDHVVTHAACEGDVGMISLLLKDKRVHPGFYALGTAASQGHFKVVERLLKDDRVYATHNYNEALSIAVSQNYNKIARLILSQPGVNPTVGYAPSTLEDMETGDIDTIEEGMPPFDILKVLKERGLVAE